MKHGYTKEIKFSIELTFCKGLEVRHATINQKSPIELLRVTVLPAKNGSYDDHFILVCEPVSDSMGCFLVLIQTSNQKAFVNPNHFESIYTPAL